MAGLAGVLSPKLRQIWNTPRSSERAHGLAIAVFLGLGILFWMGVFGMAWWFFDQCLSVQLVGQILVRRLLDMVFLTFLSVLLFSNIITAFTTLLLADDLSLLMAGPVPTDRLYHARLIETTVVSSWMVLVFGLPILAAAGVAFGAGVEYYVLTALVLPPFLVIPAVAGALVTLLLGSMFAAQRSQRVLMFLAVLAFAVLYLFFRLLQPERLLDPDGFNNLVEFLAAFQAPGSIWLPSYWATETLFPVLRGEGLRAWPYLGLLYSTAAAAVVAGTWMARPAYPRAFSRALEGRSREGASSRVGRVLTWPLVRLASDRAGRPPSVLRQMVLKDARVFFRDTAQWSQLVLLGALVVVYVLNFKNFKLMEATGTLTPVSLHLINQGLSGFVMAALAVRFVFPAVSLEGRGFWILRSAPVPMGQFLWAKFWGALAPLASLACLLALLTNYVLETPLVLTVFSVATTAVVAVGVTGLGTGLGAMYPRFKIDNPAQIASGFGGLVYMIGAMLLIFTVLCLQYKPVKTLYHVFALGAPLARQDPGLSLVLSLSAVAVSAACGWLPVRAGAKALERLGG